MTYEIEPRNYIPVAEVLASDAFNFLEQTEQAFECLIYKPLMSSEGNETDDIEHVGTLEHKETKLTYSGLVKTRAVELPGDLEGRSIVATGEFGSGETDATTFVFQDTEVPEQSIILVNDVIPGGEIQTMLYYALKILPIGKHGAAGKKHVLIAYRGSFQDLLDDDLSNDLPGHNF